MVENNGKIAELTAEQKLEALKTEIAGALASGNNDLFMSKVGEVAKFKAEISKAQAETAKKEAEALSGVRVQLATQIQNMIKSSKGMMSLVDKLVGVKASGFTFNLDLPDTTGAVVEHKSVALLVPTVKTSKTRSAGSGNSAGKTKEQYGIGLDEAFQKFATESDKAEYASVKADATITDKTKNSKLWAIKNKVKKAAIESGTLKPVS